MSVFLRRVSEQRSVFFVCFSRFIINKISFNFQQLPQNIFLWSNLQYTVGYMHLISTAHYTRQNIFLSLASSLVDYKLVFIEILFYN